METDMRESGLDAMHSLAWGAHFCQFYYDERDLADTLLPYFAAGLRNNERCVWVAGAPLGGEQAHQLLRRGVPQLEAHIARGQLEIREAGEAPSAWRELAGRALEEGYAGLRIAGNNLCRLDGVFGRERMLALCTFCVHERGAQDVIDVVRHHQFALARRHGQWEMIESASRRTRALEEALRGRDQFLAMLAHELRNPLAPIRSAAQLVRLLACSEANLVCASDVLDRQVQHLSRLVDDLLDGARITRGAITLRREPLAVAEVVARCTEGVRPVMAARGHALRASAPAEPLHVNADPTRLAQVLGNLLDNAAKYTPRGGTIELTAEREADEALFRVRDTGVGIPAEMLSHIFDVFTQVEPTMDRSMGGLGLGLALVRRLVEMHGGRVEAKSAGSGEGSEFIVRLPLAEAPREAEAPPRRAVYARRRILVVDDNRDSTTTLAMTLKLLGHEVHTALSAMGALEAALHFRPEIVLLDIGLPGMDGYEVARRLRELPATRHARLIALTGYGRDEDRRRGREAGFDEYQLKPIDPEKLKDLLATQSVH